MLPVLLRRRAAMRARTFLLYSVLCMLVMVAAALLISDAEVNSRTRLGIDASHGEVSHLLPGGNEQEVLGHIPLSVRQIWRERRFPIVLGVPSVDSPPHRTRRDLQRSSWLRYVGVATRANNFTGEMLVLFALGRHFSHGYVYSQAARDEASRSHDVLMFDMNDGRPTTNKRIGGSGHWGFAAEVGTSRKSMMWYATALRLFSHAIYIAKADDDVFIRVPQFLADLHPLPRLGVYWGRVMRWMPKKGNPTEMFYFVGGMCITMARDVVEHITSFTPLRSVLDSFGNFHSKEEFDLLHSLNAEHEDLMLGRILYETRHPNITLVFENTCRFHDIHVGGNKAPLTSRSVVVHHLKEEEYAFLAKLFLNESAEMVKPMTFDRSSSPFGEVGWVVYSYLC
ncbi:putative UDP-Gal or UDP-GlcNAc-dependent glycosyltransferase [Trypanosoma cruzi]|uniref:Hexosyltransferase n=2 Tax=Trypanosoma cruzi TaxID=5693 RepID=Q4CYL9_TRYCC|nr:UDP-Gal or UDP-GlcNAc-dependent glycosyltransferase, putative [Trypanosoma cruzi]EAN85373.1 UDP-Gal or UDP-GlcNAc-dependent glycosyltransferase, putative [Trypanosoma cruzi]PWV19074.1 putative UDP-Gal or UDP-GlcNAc-dependent glycosyltransferase [Trypanosoma cruzi]RNC51823.1 putative UDP-Gal or UDP-GlcNAc-dependent glycosyltransferase [Trypanosoma cruzi]|eukprot:XP_807224.1 UDP-Gal or UDP-GlcNAc-dependent glycosyltransferase [Trypanosoma cruzi strain CL Brener]